MVEELEDTYKKLSKQHNEELIRLCAKYFIKMEHYELANEAYLRLSDMKGIIEIKVALQNWKEGMLLAKLNPHMQSVFYKPYADYLMEQGEFEKAQEAYKRAGRKDLTLEILHSLAESATIEKRFKDAGYYYWKEALELLGEIDNKEDYEGINKYKNARRLSYIYCAYDVIDNYLLGRTTFKSTSYVFNAACYLINILGTLKPLNISLVSIYYAIGILGAEQGAYSTALKALETLRTMKIPSKWQNIVNIQSIKLQAGPFIDQEKINPICSCCMNANPLLHYNDDRCLICNHPFIRSFISFSTISLVEFKLVSKISHEEAMDLIKTKHPSKHKRFVSLYLYVGVMIIGRMVNKKK